MPPSTPNDSDIWSELEVGADQGVACAEAWATELFGGSRPETVYFQAGEILIREQQQPSWPHALLIMEGELEERMTAFMPGLGLVDQPIFFAREGDFVHVQALVPGYQEHPPLCSLHAITDGYGFIVRLEHIPAATAILLPLFRKTTEALERERQMLGLYGGVVSLFQNSPMALPMVPADPHQLMMRLVEALEERGYLDRTVGSRRPSAGLQLQRVHELDLQANMLRDQLDKAKEALTNTREQARQLQQQSDFEQRARAALERRVAELMLHVADSRPDSQELAEPGANAVTVMESAELEDLEQERRLLREQSRDFEQRANRLHRALELIEHDNPGLIIADDVMMLMVGEDAPSRHVPETRHTIPFMPAAQPKPPAPPEATQRSPAPSVPRPRGSK